MLINWHEGSPSWIPVHDAKQLDLLTTVKYARANHLENTRGWKWVKMVSVVNVVKFGILILAFNFHILHSRNISIVEVKTLLNSSK